MPRDALTREQPRPMLIEEASPHALARLVREQRLVVLHPIALVAPGRYGVIVAQPAKPIRVQRRSAGPLWFVAGAVVVLGAAAVAVGWWAQHGLPLLCSLFVAGAVTLAVALRKLAR